MKTFFIVLFGLAIISTEAAGGNDESKVKAEGKRKGCCFHYNGSCLGPCSMLTRASCCGSGGISWLVRKGLSSSWHRRFTCESCKRVGK